MATVFQARAVAVRPAIALVASLAVTLIAEGCVQAGGPRVTSIHAQAALIHIRTVGIRPVDRGDQALSYPQGTVTPTQRPGEVSLQAPAQRGVVLIATPATLMALQTLVTCQEAVTAPAAWL